MPHEEGRTYRFDDFTLEVSEHHLRRGSQEIPLPPKTFQTLVYLVERHGHLVKKDEILDRLWADTIVAESTLTHRIKDLRQALEDDPHHPRYIKTISGVGYKFIAKVEEIASCPPPTDKPATQTTPVADSLISKIKHRRRSLIIALAVLLVAGLAYWLFWRRVPAALESNIKSLAVLPLKILSEDASEDYLGLGIADAIITKTSQIGELTVRPTSAVLKYMHRETDSLEAARQLQTDAVLDGSIQRAGQRLRVSVNLLRVKDGASLWAESFELSQSDTFLIQDTLAKEIASRLKPKLSPAEAARLAKHYTTNPEAYEYCLKGRVNLERRTTAIGDLQPGEAAIGYFNKAIELDPKYALAYALLGDSYMFMANFTDPDNPAWVRLAEQALAQAKSLDSQLAVVHDVRSEYYFSQYGGWNLERAVQEARQAIALDPSVGHLSLGARYNHLGFEEPALREMRRALEIDPTNIMAQRLLVESYAMHGKFDEAIETHHRFFSEQHLFVLGLARALIGKNRLDKAQPLLEKAVARNAGDLQARGSLALVLALKGQFREAEARESAILREAGNNRAYHHITYDAASVYALEGKTSEAIKWLRVTAETGMPNYPLFARDPHLDRVRQQPVFIQFMAELKTRWDGYQREIGEGAIQ